MAIFKRTEFDYYVTPDGVIYYFHDGKNRFMMSQPVGLGMAPLEPRFERAPNQDGNTLIGWNLRSRSIQMIHRRRGRNRTEYWETRGDLINHMRPNRQTTDGGVELGSLVKVFPDGSERWIDVFPDDAPQFRTDDAQRWDEYSWNEPLRFLAPDPTFYDPNQVEVTFSASAPVNQLTFPIAFPIVFGQAGYVRQTTSITYPGTYKSFPIIDIIGPVENPQITNETTGELIKLNYVVPAGVIVTVDLSRDDKTVRDDVGTDGTDLIGTVSTDSDMGTFHIAPSPEAPGGVNVLTGVGFNATVGSQMVVRYYVRYVGI